MGGEKSLDFEDPVQTGQSITLTLKLMAYSRAGYYPTDLGWHIARNRPGDTLPQNFSGEPLRLRTIVLPASLEGQRQVLSSQVQSWSAQPDSEVSAQVQSWLEANNVQELPGPQETVNLQNMLFVPLAVLPLGLIVLVALLKMRG